MPSPLKPLDDVFPEYWISERPSLVYPLSKNQPYREEANRWLAFFQQKGWLQSSVVARLQSARSWASFYSKINEFRAGYFFEKKISVELQTYEARTVGSHTVEFEGAYDGQILFVEVKTPLDLVKRSGGSFNSSDTVLSVLEKAAPQLHPDHPNVVVLSDDTEVTLFIDTNAQFAVRDSFHGADGNKMSAVVLLGNCTHQEMYKMSYIVNPYANHPVNERMFAGFPTFQEQWAEMHLL